MQATWNPKNLSDKQLDLIINSLKQLCDQINPYDIIDENMAEKLKSVSIMNWEDPFKLTNQLLLKMEDVLEEKEKRNRVVQ